MKHGHARQGKRTSEYNTWVAMRARCYRDSHKDYKYYGGKGVRVCDRWLNSFDNFLSDMGNKPSPKHTIERKHNDKGYQPDNCSWADNAAQRANQSNVRKIEYKGHVYNLTQLSRISETFGVSRSTLRHRINKGVSVVDAVETPPKKSTVYKN